MNPFVTFLKSPDPKRSWLAMDGTALVFLLSLENRDVIAGDTEAQETKSIIQDHKNSCYGKRLLGISSVLSGAKSQKMKKAFKGKPGQVGCESIC